MRNTLNVISYLKFGCLSKITIVIFLMSLAEADDSRKVATKITTTTEQTFLGGGGGGGLTGTGEVGQKR